MSVSKYPLEVSDEEGTVDALNYLLSGPAGLGQNFAGFSTYTPAYLRPTFRQPFTTPITGTPLLVYASYPLNNAEPCNSTGTPVAPNALTQYVKFTFTTPLSFTPYVFGDEVDVSGIVDGGIPGDVNNSFTLTGTRVATLGTNNYRAIPATVTGTGFGVHVNITLLPDPGGAYTTGNTEVSVTSGFPGYGYNIGDTLLVPGNLLGGTSPANDLTLTVTATDSGFFNDSYTVFSSTPTYVIIQTNKAYNWPNYISGGDLGQNYLDTALSTDCNGRVTINGGNDRVFVSAQLDFDFTYTSTGDPVDIVIEINRYTGYLSTAPGSNDYTFSNPVTTVARKIHHFQLNAVFGEFSNINTYFVQFIDGPDIPFGYYWYILEWKFVTKPYYRAPFAIGGLYDATLSGTSIVQNTTYAGITPTTVTGLGSGANVDIVIDTAITTNYTDCAELTVNTGGINYKVGDILSIPGTSLGGATPANDLTLEITQIIYPGTSTCEIVTLNLRGLSAQVVKQ